MLWRVIRWLSIIVLVSVALPAGAQEKTKKTELPSKDEVIDKLDDLYRSDSSHGTLKMTVVKDGRRRTLTLEQWTRGDEHALIVIREPDREAGTATLKTDEGLWNYAPRADRLIRVPSGLLSDSWMGSHFTNDDLIRETSYEEDYESKLSWTQKDGERRLLLRLTPKPRAPVVYTRIDFFLTPESYLPTRADYYDEGKLMRTMTFSDVKKAGDRKIPHKMSLRPTDEKNEKTEMVYEKVEFGADVDDSLFTKRGLRRAAKRR